MAMASHLRQRVAIISSSSRENTLPVGLFGVLMMIAFVLSLNAAASSSGSNDQSAAGEPDGAEGSGAWRVTERGVLDRGWRREVRKALGQVDAAVKLVEPRHLANDRLGELRGLLRSGQL